MSIFSGRSRISDAAFERLLDERNAIFLFDIGCINREQFRVIVSETAKIHNNGNNVVMVLSNNSSDFLGILKLKTMDATMLSHYVYRYELSNKFTKNEIDILNSKLKRVRYPEFNFTRTVLENLILSANLMNEKNKYDIHFNDNVDEKILALFIIFATKERVSSYDVIKFDLMKELIDVLNGFPTLFESLEIENFEQEKIENSVKKFVVNSKYWLTRELGNYVNSEHNKEMIAAAYIYIITMIKLSSPDFFEQRKDYRDFILYDVMNNIFLGDKHFNQIDLTVYIYQKLYSYLSDDYQYLHQYAKSFLRYSHETVSYNEKLKRLLEALEKANIAFSKIENEIQFSASDYLLISEAHIVYTLASLYCEICMIKHYEDVDYLQKALDFVYDAIKSPYNTDDYKQDSSKSLGIQSFIRDLYTCEVNSKIKPLGLEYNKKCNEILTEARNILTSLS